MVAGHVSRGFGHARRIVSILHGPTTSFFSLLLLLLPLLLLSRRLRHACAGQLHELLAVRHPLASATEDTGAVAAVAMSQMMKFHYMDNSEDGNT